MPDWKPEIRRRLRGARLEPTREASIVAELADHLDDRYAELIDGGATAEEARLTAFEELSQSGTLAAELRRTEPSAPMETVPAGAPRAGSLPGDLLRDVRYAVRTLRKSP